LGAVFGAPGPAGGARQREPGRYRRRRDGQCPEKSPERQCQGQSARRLDQGRRRRQAAREGQVAGNSKDETKFTELNASFTIKNGVAHNQDLDAKAPLFRLGGAGDIDIGNSRLDYTAKASVVATTKGQGGADLSKLAGVTVPVKLVGPFDDIKYQVDYGAAAADIAKSRIGEKIQERIGGGKGGEADKSGSSTRDKIRGLFGR
jgi:AsmA protein